MLASVISFWKHAFLSLESLYHQKKTTHPLKKPNQNIHKQNMDSALHLSLTTVPLS